MDESNTDETLENRELGTSETLVSDPKPYRSPTAVSDGPRRSSRMGWLAAFGILLGAGAAVAYARMASETSPTEHVRGFGYEPRLAIEAEEEIDNRWDRGGDVEER